jgi:hypothetical protein
VIEAGVQVLVLKVNIVDFAFNTKKGSSLPAIRST